MDKKVLEKEFLRDFIIQKHVHFRQFEQWMRLLFYINKELEKKYDIIYQEIFYIKFYEVITIGILYLKEIHDGLVMSRNSNAVWYYDLIEKLNSIKNLLSESEFLYLEYRRHNACHMFQTHYEFIQKDLSIKKVRKNQRLSDINRKIKDLISKFGSDDAIDEYLMKKLNPVLNELYRFPYSAKQNEK